MSETIATSKTDSTAYPGLPGRDYHSPEIYELEKERVFFRNWFCFGREEQLSNPGDFLTEEVAGESRIVTRTREGELRAFYNVCSHRGTKICERRSGHVNRQFVCPYHQWSYGLDGGLLKMPNVRDQSSIEREKYGLKSVAIDSWDGMVFVNLAENPRPLLDQLKIEGGQPLSWGRYRIGELRVGHRIGYEVRANWKIIHDNYNECLHCPSVHPELAKIVPIYTLYPRAADHTTIVLEYLFRPEVIATDGFDCSEMVKFFDQVSVEDWAVCEKVQQGIRSRGYTRGVYPREDSYLRDFAERYLAERGPA